MGFRSRYLSRRIYRRALTLAVVLAMFGIIALLATPVAAAGSASPGTASAWGRNLSGQCDVPAVTTGFKMLAGGTAFSVGLKTDGSLVAWGDSSNGKLNVPAGNNFVSVAAGYDHGLALRVDGTIATWGANTSGQCDVPGPNSDFIAVAGGVAHSLGLKSNGTVVGWGLNNDDQAIPPAGNFKAIAAGGYHSAGLKTDGTISAWGLNGNLQCDVPVPNSNFVSIAAGLYHTVGIRSDHTAVAWGLNDDGQCTVPAGTYTSIAAGQYNNLGLKTDGSLAAWGQNADGQCDVPAPNAGFVSVAAGGYHALAIRTQDCVRQWGYWNSFITPNSAFTAIAASDHSLALKPDGSIAAWGYNQWGQTNVPEPNADFVFIGAGGMHSLAIKSDGSVRAWGNNLSGQLNVPGPNSGFIQVAGGSYHSVGLKSDGTLVAWGSNNYGQCNVPAGRFVSISSGVNYCVAIREDGSAVAWGDNYNGQCNVPAGTDFTAVSAGSAHCLGLRSNGTAAAWGGNWYGQCNVPAPNSDFTSLSGGSNHSMGLKSNGTAVAWGVNTYGESNIPQPNSGIVQVDAGFSFSMWMQDGLAPPLMYGLENNSGRQGASVTGLKINGRDFRGESNNLLVRIRNGGNTIVPAITGWTSTQITCDVTIPTNAPRGYWEVFVQHVDDGRSVTALNAFLVKGFTVTPSWNTGGSIVPGGAQELDYGGNMTFNVTPDGNHHIDDVLIDGVSQGAIDHYDFTNVTSDRTIQAVFGGNLYTISANSNPPCGGTITGTGEYTYYDDASLSATTNPGHWFINWTEDGEEIETDPDECEVWVDGNHHIVANFGTYTYSVKASVTGGHGTVEPVDQTYDACSNPTVTCKPDAGYRVASITDNGESKPATETYVIDKIVEDHVITVTYELAPTGPPHVAGVSPDRGSLGSTVKIEGSDFGQRLTGGRGVRYAASPSYVMFNQTQATDYVSWTDKEIEVKVPEGATPGPITVFTENGASNRDVTFTPTYPMTPVYFLAEGSTAHGFDTFINIENPMEEDLNCAVNFLLASGKVHTEMVGLPEMSQVTVNPRDFIGAQDFSTRVDCVQGKTIAVDRTMVWKGEGASGQEAHSSIGSTRPQKIWYLAEGSSQWGFETWTLVENPNDASTKLTISYMLEGGGVLEREKVLAANSRGSYSMAEDIGNVDASVLVTADLPVVTERSMYRNGRAEGHCSIGTPSPGSSFYLAEGTTSWGFTTYVLLENPNPSPATVTLTYMLPAGPSVQAPFTMPASSRRTVRANDAVSDTDFSVKVVSDKPVIAERSMYWGAGLDEACHASSGVCSPHETFYLPDGSTEEGVETFTLVENPNTSEVEIEVSYLPPEGGEVIVFDDTLQPGSRETYAMRDRLPSGRAAVKVVSKTAGKGIVAERSMYWNNRRAGTVTIGAFVDGS